MLCIDQIKKLIQDEIKYNVKVCNIKTDWLKDKEVITLDSNFVVYDIHLTGYANLTQIRRTKEIRYLLIRNKHSMYLCDTQEDHHLIAYRTQQKSIWAYFSDPNKLSEEWWNDHLLHYSKKHNRFKRNLNTAKTYLFELELWVKRGTGSNYFTDSIANEFNTRIVEASKAIVDLEEKENAAKRSEEESLSVGESA